MQNQKEFMVQNLGTYVDLDGCKYSTFKVISKKSEIEVKIYCMETLRPSYLKNEMPNPYSLELIEFKNITNLKNKELGDMYIYKVRKLGTQ